MEYQTYLRSAHWQKLKAEYWSRYDKICASCGVDYDIHLHHRIYDRLYREWWSDLVPLCRACHDTVHALVKAGQAELSDAHLKLNPEIVYERENKNVVIGTTLRADRDGRNFGANYVPIYVEGQDYPLKELDQIATLMLYQDVRDHEGIRNTDMILTDQQWRKLYRVEIYTEQGWPDPAYTMDRFGNHIEGMYWRSHPQGRPHLNEDQRRATGAGFYDSRIASDREIVPPPVKAPAPKQAMCAFEGCPDLERLRGYCATHYTQIQKGQQLRPKRVGISREIQIEIKKRRRSGETLTEIARVLGVSNTTVSRYS